MPDPPRMCQVDERTSSWPYVRRCRNGATYPNTMVRIDGDRPEQMDLCADHYSIARREGVLVDERVD